MSEPKETNNNLSGESLAPHGSNEPVQEEKKEEVKKEEEKLPDPSNSSKTAKNGTKNRQRLSIRRTMRGNAPQEQDLKATLLTFQAVVNKPDQARVQLLLCNISDRDIFVKLRCNSNSNVTALPASSGHISPKSQMRILLNWKMPEGAKIWSELPMPKILLTTYFMQKGERSNDEAPTNTRLMARVSTSKQCDADNSPIEQLLLDAVGKDNTGVTGANPSTPNTAIPQTMTPPDTPEKRNKEKHDEKEADDMRWILVALVAIIVLLLLQK